MLALLAAVAGAAPIQQNQYTTNLNQQAADNYVRTNITENALTNTGTGYIIGAGITGTLTNGNGGVVVDIMGQLYYPNGPVLTPLLGGLNYPDGGQLIKSTAPGTLLYDGGGPFASSANGGTLSGSVLFVTNQTTLTGDAKYNGAEIVTNAAPAVQSLFNVKSFGAFGDGHFAGGVSTTNISGTCHLGAASANFSASDVGDQIQVICGNTNAQSWFSTIASVISPTVCTLSTVPNILYTNFYFCIYGQHDDSSAIQATINAAWANGGGSIYMPAGVYLIETNFVNTNQNNAQLIIPYFSGAGGGSPQVAIYGDNSFRIWSVPNDNFAPSSNQTSMVEMRTGNNNASTNFFASSLFDARAFNGIAPTAGADMNNSFNTYRGNNCVLAFHDFGIWMPYNGGSCALPLIPMNDSIPGGGVWNVEIAGVVGPSNGDAFSTNAPSLSTNSIGIIAPGSFEGTYGRMDDVYVAGFYDGIESGLINSKRVTINDCINPVNTRLQPNVVADFYDFNVSDSSNVVVAGARASANSIRIHNFSAIQATLVGESGWWTTANQINAVYDPSGAFNTSYCEMELPYTNGGMPIVINEPNTSGTAKGTKGFFWSVESAPGNSRAYATSTKVFNSPMDFNSLYGQSSGAGGGWDYTFSDLLDNGNLSVAGNLSVTGTLSASIAVPIETQLFYNVTNCPIFTNGLGGAYQQSLFKMQGGGDFGEASGGTRGAPYWIWGFQDNAGTPLDNFPAADFVFVPQTPGVANAIPGIVSGYGIGVAFTTNGTVLAYGGFAAYTANNGKSTGLTSIATFPATTTTWTNTTTTSITVYINNASVTGTATSVNGVQIFGTLLGDVTITLKPGDYFSETYTVGTPSAKYMVYP